MKRLCISSVYQGRQNQSIPRPMSRQIVVQVATGHLVGSQLDSIQRLVYLRDQPATLPNREKRKKKRVILWVPSAGQQANNQCKWRTYEFSQTLYILTVPHTLHSFILQITLHNKRIYKVGEHVESYSFLRNGESLNSCPNTSCLHIHSAVHKLSCSSTTRCHHSAVHKQW